ncbi:MAG: 50S ribosomal protein L3 [Candidatus Aminicenantia bacterium]
MPERRRPRRGSMGFYPRKRARRIYPRVKHTKIKEVKPLGFAGYKAGMTHVMLIDSNPNSRTKGQEIMKSITVLECPPLSVFGFRCYGDNIHDFFADKLDKNLKRKIKKLPKPKKPEKLPENIKQVVLLCHTNPGFKKKPEVFEIPIGGTIEEQIKYAQENLGKQIDIKQVFKEGDLIDVSAITKGKGFQGPVKRFGIKVLGRKAQQMQRHTGALGTKEPGKVRFTVPQAGQLGFQTRTELNKRILKIDDSFEIKGGFVNYGNVKNTCLLIEGSVPGPKKRLIRMRFAMRPKKVFPIDIKYISKESKQGV